MRVSTRSRFMIGLLLITGIAAAMSGGSSVQAQTAAPADMHDMGGHMAMTNLRPVRPGDQERADAIIVAARKAAEPYRDYRKALAEGYIIFAPNVPQHIYHFTRDDYGIAAARRFDPDKPTSLLYEKTSVNGARGYKLVGVMYTDRIAATEEELDGRIPLSIAQWHQHTDFCLPPRGDWEDLVGPNARFGLKGSITTEAECKAAGGRFLSHVFGWMVHVYPFEADPARVWRVGMDDDR